MQNFDKLQKQRVRENTDNAERKFCNLKNQHNIILLQKDGIFRTIYC